jgi:hypothetical protein
MRGRKLELYGLIMAAERKELYASVQQTQWILNRYPPEKEWGRDFEPLAPDFKDAPRELVVPDEHA